MRVLLTHPLQGNITPRMRLAMHLGIHVTTIEEGQASPTTGTIPNGGWQ